MLLLDNYDSFTWNLFHYLGELGARLEVRRNDQLSVEDALRLGRDGIVISPGPCDPARAGISVPLVRAASEARVPLLGVCLGHQSIFEAFGGRIDRAPAPMHGKTSGIHHDGTGLFRDVTNPFEGTRYHSLHGTRETLPEGLRANAWSDDGVIMGIEHRERAIFGVQFHPESIETRHGHALLRNFLDHCPTAVTA